MRSKFISGLIAGALLGTGITYSISELRLQEELERNLSQNVVKAEIVESQPPDHNMVPLPENIAEDEAYIMVYVSDVNDAEYKLPVSTQEYFRYKQMSHRKKTIEDYVNWVTFDDPKIKVFAEYLTKDLSSPEEKAATLLYFVHRHIYDARIEKEIDYIRYPLETMVEKNGDCEDFAILGAALMKSIGIDVAIVFFPPKTGENIAHVGLGVNGDFSGSYFNIEGKKYYYAETTGTDWLKEPAEWEIGDLPFGYRSRKANVYIVK